MEKLSNFDNFDRPVDIGEVPVGEHPLGPQGVQGGLLPPSCGESRLGPLAARQRLDSSNGKIGEVEEECACTRWFEHQCKHRRSSLRTF